MTFSPGPRQQARAELCRERGPASTPYDRGSARSRLAVSLTKLLIVRDEHGYSSAKLPLYFEWHGKSPSSGPLLLLLHGGGSTIESNWGRLIPALESSGRMLAVELQGHGRTGSGDQAASFEGSADGVAALLQELSVGPVDVLGFSNGGQVGMHLAIRQRPPAHRAWKSRRLSRRTRGRSGRSRAAPTGTSFSGQLPGPAGDHHRELSANLPLRVVVRETRPPPA